MLEKTPLRPAPRRVSRVGPAPEAKGMLETGGFRLRSTLGIRLDHDVSGPWRTVLPRSPGDYPSWLLVDGEGQDPEDAADRGRNPFGPENGVLKVL